jgi:hypothetical protein
MVVQLPNGNDGLPADVGVLHYHGIRGSKFTLDAAVSGLLGVSIPRSPEVALRRAEKTKFEKYSEGLRSHPDIRFIPFAITEFDTLGGHATAFMTELAKQTVWRWLRPRLGCPLLPRRSSPAPCAASVPVLPRLAREAPLAASTCCILGVGYEFPQLKLKYFTPIPVKPAEVSAPPLMLCLAGLRSVR